MIDSAQNPRFKQLLKLKQKKQRLEEGLFLVEGEHLVEEAIASGYCELLIANAAVPYWNQDTLILSPVLLKQLSELESSKLIFALCRIPKEQKPGKRVLLLDGIQDPGNLGTLIRSAAAFDFDTIVYENTVDVYSQKVIRSSQGALFKLSLISMELSAFINAHKDYQYYGTSVNQGLDVRDIVPKNPKIAIVLGNEGQGVREDILKLVNQVITIPMAKAESLNVGVAGSIIMYHFSLF
ncbi:MAG: RNA methyltransferase [Candidatus Izemoplasmatales bacterium]|nr:RNA methyltransferase [Candidatus Izemoplasmatales bacterium]